MRAAHAISVLALLVATGGCARGSAAPPPVDERVAAANTGFGLTLLQRHLAGQPATNVFISPASVSTALALAYNGAAGDTAMEMAETLGWAEIPPDDLNDAFLALREGLERPGRDVTLEIGNSLWVTEGVNFGADYIARNREFFRADLSQFDFQSPDAPRRMNNWVRRATRGKVSEIVTAPIPGAPVAILLNAIYFEGGWTERFDPQRTSAELFTLADGAQVRVPTMRRSGMMDYQETATFQAVRLPYGDGRFAMYVFLPSEEQSLADFFATLTLEELTARLAGFTEQQVSLALPRFRLEYDTLLNETLEVLGMGLAFTPSADFSGMTGGGPGDVWIAEIRHRTYVEVEEEGTKAAAATGVRMTATATMALEMTVDRPFLCVIRDDETEMLLFLGAVHDPAQATP